MILRADKYMKNRCGTTIHLWLRRRSSMFKQNEIASKTWEMPTSRSKAWRARRRLFRLLISIGCSGLRPKEYAVSERCLATRNCFTQVFQQLLTQWTLRTSPGRTLASRGLPDWRSGQEYLWSVPSSSSGASWAYGASNCLKEAETPGSKPIAAPHRPLLTPKPRKTSTYQ